MKSSCQVLKALLRGDCKWLKYILLAFLVIAFFYAPNGSEVSQPIAVIGWELNVSRATRVYVVPENETSLISGKQLCHSPEVELIIVICSAPPNAEQRTAIRETWGTYPTEYTNVRIAFLLGTTSNTSLQTEIATEQNEHHDIIQENFIDSYNNLTIKSVMMLKWFVNYCPNAKYLMKTDDDMFVNVSRLVSILKDSHFKPSELLIGSLHCNARPILDANNKWYVPKYIYHGKKFPNYLSGTGYVMSRQVAVRLYKVALTVNLVHLEDVFITGICAARAGIAPRNHVGFNFVFIGLMAHCYDHRLVTNHRLSPELLYKVWRQKDDCEEYLATRSTTTTTSTPAPIPPALLRRARIRPRPVCR